MRLIRSPTNMCWLVGRIQTSGESDFPNVRALQRQFKLTLLSRWPAREANPSFSRTGQDSAKNAPDPASLVEQMTADEFFARLGKLMTEQPPAAADVPIFAALNRFGLEPGKLFSIDEVNRVRRFLLGKALVAARKKLRETVKRDRGRGSDNNWSVIRSGIGAYHTNYEIRAFVAMIGLGALPAEEAAYANAQKDGKGKPLGGRFRYRIHFDAGQTPPVDAFWSLTLYDRQGFLVDNAIRRYTVGDRDLLSRNSDGSMDIFIQQDFPITGSANWLPSGQGPFEITMRLYMPRKSFLDGSWKPPAIERLCDK
jgi:hypothetical protein